MSLPIKLISTDFDGTLFAEFENPPIPHRLADLLGTLQAQGAKWVINTGREMASLMEALARARLPVQPDYLVLVEREIHRHDGVRYVGLDGWNKRCHRDHEVLFDCVRPDMPALMEWVNDNFDATVYSDSWSPFCLIAGNNSDADRIEVRLNAFCQRFPDLAVVRNDVYARFCHASYNKGVALAELTRLEQLASDQVFAAGDHLNDLPMLQSRFARHLVAPRNSIAEVQTQVLAQGGFVSEKRCGEGVLEGLEKALAAYGS